MNTSKSAWILVFAVSITALVAISALAARPAAETVVSVSADGSIAPVGYDLLPEQLDMPPVPESDLLRRAESPRMIAHRGPFTSIQVNVNAAQNNIVGDAANESTIAISLTDPSKIVIAWRQFDSIASNFREAGMAYSHNTGQTWTMFTLDNGQFRSDPVLGADAAGRFLFSSLSSTTTVELFRSLDGGVNWTETGAFGGDKQWIAVDERPAGMGAGHIYQIWNVQFSCCPPNDFCRSINNGVTMQNPVAIPTPSMKWGTLDTGPDGTLYLAGSNLNQTGHLFTKSTTARDPGLTPTFQPVTPINLGGVTTTGGALPPGSPNPGGLLGQVIIAVDNSAGPTSGNIYVLGSVRNTSEPNPLNVKFIRSTDGGQTWSAPVLVNDDPNSGAVHWFGTMSVAPNGRIDVIWNDTRNDPNDLLTETYYSYSLDAGTTWAPNIPLTPQWNPNIGFPQQNKIGDYYHMVSDNGGANLAYAATFNGEEDVYFLRIDRDCNDNGVDDDCDITCGAPGTRCDVPGCGLSSDCNDNGIPDDCEPNDDCNNNTIPDICDIGAGTSDDCNLNQIPDECESALDCNNNGDADFCDIASGFSQDCNGNTIPDECDIGTISNDLNQDGVPDECQGACCTCGACNDVSQTACQALGGQFSGFEVLCGDAGACTPSPVPANDLCASAIFLASVPSLTEAFDNNCASLDGPSPVNCPQSQPFGTDLWYKYAAPCTGSVTVRLCDMTPLNFDTIVDVYQGASVCPCPTTPAGVVTCGDDTCGVGGGPSEVTFNVTEGFCYTIRIAGWNGDVGAGSFELFYNTTCSVEPPPPPIADPSGINKCRFISFVNPLPPPPNPQAAASAGSPLLAIRVHLVSLHHVVPPYSGAPSIPFTAFEGQVRWVGPPATYTESAADPTTFRAAFLQCTPNYHEWMTEGLLHVTGSAIVPSSIYRAEYLADTCMGNEDTCTRVSTQLEIHTTRWGDIAAPFNPPSPSAQSDVTDISAVVDKFRSAPGSLIKARALVHGDAFGVINLVPEVDFAHISQVVDSFRGVAYPFTIAECP